MRFSCLGPVGLSLLFFSASGTHPAAAQTAPASGVLAACGPASLRLRVANPDSLPGRVTVVRLATGQPLFTATYRAAYGHHFDFAGAPAGTYLVRLRLGRAHTTYRVRLNAQAQLMTEPATVPLAQR